MFRIALKLIGKALGLLVPFIVPAILGFSIIDHLPVKIAGATATHEQIARAALSLLALGFVSAADVLDTYLPREKAREFGRQYFQELLMPSFVAKLAAANLCLGRDVRINVMFARRVWWLFYLGRRFTWYANRGFEPEHGHHHDAGIGMFTFQGLAGQAFRTERALAREISNAELCKDWPSKWLFQNEFRLGIRQLRRTQDVRAILSVPIYQSVGDDMAKRSKAVGVINVDAVSPDGAKWLASEVNQKDVATALAEFGKVLACLG